MSRSKTSEEIEKEVTTTDWEDLSCRLVVYTKARLSGMSWRGVKGAPVPGGWEIEDFVLKAIENFLSNPDRWDPSNMKLLDHLKGLISSHVNHVANYIENRKENRSTTLPEEVNAFTVDVSQIRDRTDVSRADFSIFVSEKRNEILATLRDDPEARRVVEAVLDSDLYAPREIAEFLGIEIDEVYNVKRRLKRNGELHEVLRNGSNLGCENPGPVSAEAKSV